MGFVARQQSPTIMINNSLYLNDVGVYLTESSDNAIYENQFSNFLNAVDDGKNIWNSSFKR